MILKVRSRTKPKKGSTDVIGRLINDSWFPINFYFSLSVA